MTIRTTFANVLLVIMLVVFGSSVFVLQVLGRAKDDADIINALGRQRMLSQSMGKSVLGFTLGKSVLGNIERNILEFDKYVTAMRKVYTEVVVTEAAKANVDLTMSLGENSHPYLPFPATFTRLINSEYSAASPTNISIISENPINPEQGLETEIDFQANAFLKKNPDRTYYAAKEESGKLVLNYYTADIATVEDCATCHEDLEGRQYRLGDLLGIRRYEILFSENPAAAHSALHPNLDEYREAETVFSSTLLAAKNGGVYPADGNSDAFKETKAIDDPAMQAKIVEIERALTQFKHSVELIDLSETGGLSRYKLIEELMALSNDLLRLSEQLVSQYTAIANNKQEMVYVSVILSLLFVSLASLFMYFFFYSRVVRPLGEMTKYMTDLANGDTQSTVPCCKHKDEVGEISNAVEVFRLTAIEREKAEAKLKEAIGKAEEANKTKSDFLANMSHELRTPLNAIIGFSNAMQEGVFGSIDNEKYKEYINNIHDSGEHLLELIGDILDLSKVEANALKLDETNIDLTDIFTAAKQMLQKRAEAGQIEVTMMAPSDIPTLRGDERRLKQILANLLSNAIKFTPAGGYVSMEARCDEQGAIVLAISDNGVGMTEKEVATALNVFGQVDNGLFSKHEGTGLGLPLTKALVELHGGTLEIVSRKAQGTRITLRFPSERTGATG